MSTSDVYSSIYDGGDTTQKVMMMIAMRYIVKEGVTNVSLN